jgi:hypothetical protein
MSWSNGFVLSLSPSPKERDDLSMVGFGQGLMVLARVFLENALSRLLPLYSCLTTVTSDDGNNCSPCNNCNVSNDGNPQPVRCYQGVIMVSCLRRLQQLQQL